MKTRQSLFLVSGELGLLFFPSNGFQISHLILNDSSQPPHLSQIFAKHGCCIDCIITTGVGFFFVLPVQMCLWSSTSLRPWNLRFLNAKRLLANCIALVVVEINSASKLSSSSTGPDLLVLASCKTRGEKRLPQIRTITPLS